MRKIGKRKKLITVNIGILLLASMLVYPIFANETISGEEKSSIIQEPIKEILINNKESKAKLGQRVVGSEFTDNIINNGVKNLPCTFTVLTLPENGNPGTVKTKDYGAIATTTTGTISFPDEVMDGTDRYIITEIGMRSFAYIRELTSSGLEKNKTITSVGQYAFSGCVGFTSTGLESALAITNVGNYAFAYCEGLTSTGLETNKTIKSIGNSAFAMCAKLTQTGLESNDTITTLGNSVFDYCTGLTSTGLERNTTVKVLGNYVFTSCTKLNEIRFEILTLPTFGSGVFNSSGVNIYYLPETTNPEVLKNCGAATLKEATVASVELSSDATKTSYIEEQTFDPTGLVLNVTYDKLAAQPRSYADFATYFSFDKSEVKYGDTNVVITYGGQSVNQPITVERKKITNIEINTAPTKVAYIEEQTFNPNGLVITVNYDDGKSEGIIYNDGTKNDFSFDKEEVKLGDTSITITYGGKSTSQEITVKKKTVTDINIKTPSAKKEYIEGQIFDPTGLVVTANYDNGKSEEIVYNNDTKNDFSFDKDELKLGDTGITISYKGKTASQTINVKEKTTTNVEIKTAPTKVSYIEREHFEPEGLVLTVYYDNGKSEEIAYNDSTKDDFNFDITILNYRDTEVVLTYKGKNISQEVSVEAKPIAEIGIKETPKKIEYIEGTRFDPTGMNITVNYEDGDSAIIAYNEKTKIDFSFRTISKARLLMNEEMPILELGSTDIEVSYRGEVATLLTIEVKEKEVTEIKVVTPPTKVEYQEGEVVSLEGLVLEVSYNNGSKEEVIYEESNKDMFTYNTNTLATKDTKVEIEYKGNKVEIEIKVKATPEKTPIEKEETVETGDTTMVAGYIGMVSISLLGVGYMVKKRKS